MESRTVLPMHNIYFQVIKKIHWQVVKADFSSACRPLPPSALHGAAAMIIKLSARSIALVKKPSEPKVKFKIGEAVEGVARRKCDLAEFYDAFAV